MNVQRRKLITLLGGAAATFPLPARAQVAGKVWRIGFLATNTPVGFSGQRSAFLQGMRDLGYVEGKDFVIELRYAYIEYERSAGLAAELLQLNADVLLGPNTPAVRALQQATRTIPRSTGVRRPTKIGIGESCAASCRAAN